MIIRLPCVRPAYRPEVAIFTRDWPHQQYRVDLNPCFVRRRPPAQREDKKDKKPPKH